MKILYISYLSDIYSQGPNWSVPAGVQAQGEIDDVFWINISNAIMEHWKLVPAFHSRIQFKALKLSLLPSPFDKPDVVVFEGFYNFMYCKFAKVLKHNRIPYIIIPRGELTEQAQNNRKWLKKRVANLFLFRNFVRKACGIQYLTEKEYKDSGNNWNKKYCIIPNGFNLPQRYKSWANRKEQIRAVYIGRMDPYHKGLDLLIDACERVAVELRRANFILYLHGPERFGCREQIKQLISQKGLDDLLLVGEGVCGDEKIKILLQSDVFVMTSRFEGHPMGLIEALAYGLPCVVSEGTNMYKEILSADAGWGATNDIESIASAFLQMLNDTSVFATKGYNARLLAKNYSWELIAKKTTKEYERLLTK